jgi:hypothetical protein
MIFLRANGHDEADETPNSLPPVAATAEILFDTNERLKKSDIAVTHSKQTTDFLFDTNKSCKMSAVPVTPSKSMTVPFSIRYKWTLCSTPPLSKNIANSAVRILRA